jgi:two-component system sensor histidine kinase RegB
VSSTASQTLAPSALTVNFAWLARLRFGAVLGQAGVILGVHFGMAVELPLTALSAVIALELTLNGWALWHLRSERVVRERHVALAVGADLLLFSALLYFSGGPSNPFSFLYLIHIALAAIVLPQRTSFGLVGLALACSLGLFFGHVPLPHDHSLHHGFGWHQRGMWVAFGIAACFIVYFIQRVLRELSMIEGELRASRERAARGERVTALAMLSTGAAHELSSPLSTIAVASRELLRRLPEEATSAREDLELIRAQVERCRTIIDQLSTDAGQPAAGVFGRLQAQEIVEQALVGFEPSRIELSGVADGASVNGPLRPLAQALRNLLSNALDAGGPHDVVELSIGAASGELWFEVSDRGSGMPADVLARATEPFFTTKPRGRGMGLGLFLAESVADQLGGRLVLDSRPGRGTRARLVLPVAATKGRMAEATHRVEAGLAGG